MNCPEACRYIICDCWREKLRCVVSADDIYAPVTSEPIHRVELKPRLMNADCCEQRTRLPPRDPTPDEADLGIVVFVTAIGRSSWYEYIGQCDRCGKIHCKYDPQSYQTEAFPLWYRRVLEEESFKRAAAKKRKMIASSFIRSVIESEATT